MASILVIGSGVVGKASGKGFLAKGHEVAFCDIDSEILGQLSAEGYVVCAPDSLRESQASIFILTVSTPTVEGKIKLHFLKKAVENLGRALCGREDFPLVVVRSTVPPGTTRKILIPLLEKHSGMRAGPGFGVCMNPEYLRETSSKDDFQYPWLITIGALDKRSGGILADLYGPQNSCTCPVAHVTLEEAELQKYVHNLWNATKITFFNEMRRVARMIEADPQKIFELVTISAEASWSKEYGTRDLGPFSGSCLPKDTEAFLTWVRENLGIELPQLEATIQVNRDMTTDARRMDAQAVM